MSDESTSAPGAKAATTSAAREEETQKQSIGWRRLLSVKKSVDESSSVNSIEEDKNNGTFEKWSLGILNDKLTEEVPGKRGIQPKEILSNVIARYCLTSFLKP